VENYFIKPAKQIAGPRDKNRMQNVLQFGPSQANGFKIVKIYSFRNCKIVWHNTELIV